MLALETNEKANFCEPFIEVYDTLNKLKNGNVIQDILDNDDEYLILKGISSKLTRNLLETFENIEVVGWSPSCKQALARFSA